MNISQMKNRLEQLKNNVLNFHKDERENYYEKDQDSFADSIMLEYDRLQKLFPESDYDLPYQINKFLNWYLVNIINDDSLNDFAKKEEVSKLNNFIEKMAVWYELRFPNYEIDKMLGIEEGEDIDIDNVMFYHNPVISGMLENYLELGGEEVLKDFDKLKWEDFYGIKMFIASLSEEERNFLKRPKYPEELWLSYFELGNMHTSRNMKVMLSSKGKVLDCKWLYPHHNKKIHISASSLIGMTLRELGGYMKERGILFNNIRGDSLEDTIRDYENKKYFKEELFNCVMYRIIEHGGEQYGPRRAYLFAKEFGLNKDIPMIYGASYFVPGSKEFYQMYLKEGGSLELKCFVDYFCDDYMDKKMVTVRDFIKDSFYYTAEEDTLHQRLIQVLDNRKRAVQPIVTEEEQEVIRKEEIHSKRLQRKLDKSRNGRRSF